MLHYESLLFLAELEVNNQRDWFHGQKKRYEQVLKQPFQDLVSSLLDTIRQHDPTIGTDPKKMIFRINRDTRFSKDKSPYKTHVSAILSPQGTKDKEYPGMYLQIGCDKVMLGGGAYFVLPEKLQLIRQKIAADPATFQRLVSDPLFTQYYKDVQGERNVRLPKEYQSVIVHTPYIANKQFYFMTEMEGEAAIQPDFVDVVEKHYLGAKPLLDYLSGFFG